LTACEAFASRNEVESIEAGVNLGRSEAYREMLSDGFKTEFQGRCDAEAESAGVQQA
jgi:hypothetical protein